MTKPPPETPEPSIRRILCPIDFSDFSRRAVEQVVPLARACAAEITALFVFPLDPPAPEGLSHGPAPVVPDEGARAAVAADLKPFLRPLREAGIPVDIHICAGDPAKEILRRADAMAADVIVMATHGRSGFQRWVLGSVADKVVRMGPCPVLTVSRPDEASSQAKTGAVARILCALDLSESSDRTLAYAYALARTTGARVNLLHVVEGMPEVGTASVEAVARVRLHEAAQRGPRGSLIEETVVVGKPYREILRVALEQGVDLIVMGTHGANPVDRMFFGSTADHVVREAPVPVLTVREVRTGSRHATDQSEHAAFAVPGVG